MFFDLIIFLSGILCLIIASILLANYKNNEFRSIYLIILLLIAFLHRVFYAFLTLEIINFKIKYSLNLAYFIIPIYFLLLKELLKIHISKREKIILIFITCTVLFLKKFNYLKPETNFSIFLSYSCVVFIFTLRMFYKSFVNSNYNYRSVLFKFIAIILFHVAFLFFGINYLMFYDLYNVEGISGIFYRVSSFSWLIILSFMFFNPELLFGKSKLQKIIMEDYLEGIKVWSQKPIIKLDNKDIKLSKNVKNISSSITKIEKILDENPNYFQSLSKDNLHEIIRIPKSHSDYIFKYHCYLNKHQFKRYFQINFVINQIKKGYLKNHTIESLYKLSGYRSKMSFYRSFKKFTNSTPTLFAQKNSEFL